MIAIYHEISPDDNQEKAINDIIVLLHKAQKEHPDVDRILYCDITGHRDWKGNLDIEMDDFRNGFGFVGMRGYFKQVTIDGKEFTNDEQMNGIPLGVTIQSPDDDG